jgi:hypothetical protein
MPPLRAHVWRTSGKRDHVGFRGNAWCRYCECGGWGGEGVVATLRQYTRDIGKNLVMSVEPAMAEVQRWKRGKGRIDGSGPRAGAQRLCWTGTVWAQVWDSLEHLLMSNGLQHDHKHELMSTRNMSGVVLDS